MTGAVDAGHQPHLLFPAVRLPLSRRAQVVAGRALADDLTVDAVLDPVAALLHVGVAARPLHHGAQLRGRVHAAAQDAGVARRPAQLIHPLTPPPHRSTIWNMCATTRVCVGDSDGVDAQDCPNESVLSTDPTPVTMTRWTMQEG
jgi:hypothetical protein